MVSPSTNSGGSTTVNSFLLPHGSCPTAKWGKALNVIIKDNSPAIYHIVGRLYVLGCGILMPVGSIAYHAGAAALKLPIATIYACTFWIPIHKDDSDKWVTFGSMYPDELTPWHVGAHVVKTAVSFFNIFFITPVGLGDPELAVWWMQITCMIPQDKMPLPAHGTMIDDPNIQNAKPATTIATNATQTTIPVSPVITPSVSATINTVVDDTPAATPYTTKLAPTVHKNVPPPPPLPHRNHSGRPTSLPGNLMNDLHNHFSTKKNKDIKDLEDQINKNRPTPLVRSQLLSDIRTGVQLKSAAARPKANVISVPVPSTPQQDIADSLRAALDARKNFLNESGYDSDSDSQDTDGNYWD